MSVVRVHHVITSLDVGGAEMMLAKLVAAPMPGVQHSVTTLLPPGRVADRLPSAVALTTAGMRGAADLPRALRIVRGLVRRDAPHVIHGWMYHGNFVASAAAAPSQRRVIWNVRQSLVDMRDEKRSTQWVIRASAPFSRAVRAIVYNSTRSIAEHARVGFDPRRAEFIPNGFDVARFVPDPTARASARSELGLRAASFVLGHFARVQATKNQLGFLAAARRIAAEVPSARFLVVGRGAVAFVRNALAGADGAVLSDRLVVLDERSDIARLMCACDVVCLTSLVEGFPNVVGEAMACATPCVVTDAGECREIVGATGRVVPAGDDEAFAAACIELARLEPDALGALGHAARERIVDRFSMTAVAQQYASLFQRVAA